MKNVPEGGIVIVGSYGVRYMTGGIFYPFRQNSDLLYLTGFEEPDCCVVLVKKASTPNGYSFTMFVRPKNPTIELWDGPRCGPEGCKHFFGADEAYCITTLSDQLDRLVEEASKQSSDGSVHIYTDLPVTVVDPSDPNPPPPRQQSFHNAYSVTDPSREERELCLSNYVRKLIIKDPWGGIKTEGGVAGGTTSDDSGWWTFGLASKPSSSRRAGPSSGVHLRPLKPILQDLRVLKSEAECSLLHQAGQITGSGFHELMRACYPGGTEHQLFAAFDGATRLAGATRIAYVPVVASGRNALTLHYVHNRGLLGSGELVLVDAGVEYEGYVSDVTRTIPVDGKYTEGQRQLYEAVLKVQKACVAVGFGERSLVELDKRVIQVTTSSKRLHPHSRNARNHPTSLSTTSTISPTLNSANSSSSSLTAT